MLLQNDMEREVEGYLRRKYEANLQNVEVVWREDLDLVRGAVKLQAHVAVSGLLLHKIILSTPTWGDMIGVSGPGKELCNFLWEQLDMVMDSVRFCVPEAWQIMIV